MSIMIMKVNNERGYEVRKSEFLEMLKGGRWKSRADARNHAFWRYYGGKFDIEVIEAIDAVLPRENVKMDVLQGFKR